MMRGTDRPFAAALDDLLAERDWSNRHLATITREKFDWGSHGTINFLINGELAPSRRAMEVIASVLEISPRHFPEYRLLLARDKLDPERVGLDAALSALAACPHLAK